MRKLKWTPEKEEYLRDHFFSMNLKKLSKKLEVTETAVMIKAKRLGLKRKVLIEAENYYTQQEILLEAKKRNIYITRDILLSLIKNKVIKKHQFRDNSLVYFSKSDYDFIFDFFSKYEMLMTLNKRLKDKGLKFDNRKFLHGFLVENVDQRIEIKRLDNISVLFISLESSAFVENLLLNYLTMAQFAEQVYYSRSGINYLINNKIINTIKFANKHWINKSFVEKIKLYYKPKVNQYK